MANFNKVILTGNLTRDPHLAALPSQREVAEFGMAINREWTDRQSGQKRKETCFVECKCFGKQASTVKQYLSKGDPLLVEGRLTFDQWESKDGGKRSKHFVVVEQFQFLSSGKKPAPANEDPF